MLQASESLKLCIKWLRSGDLTEAELRRRLTSKGRPEEEIADAVAYVQQRKWQSDDRVVERAKESANSKLEGKAKVKAKLLRQGIDEDALGSALSELSDDSESGKARTLLNQKLKPGDSPAKAARLLASRGFEEEAIRSALQAVFPEWEG